MKKSIKIIAVAVAALMLCLALVSCDLFGKKLDGKYECEVALTGTYTMNFDGKEVTLTRKGLLGTVDKWEGVYEIDDDVITFTFMDDDGEEIEDAPFAGDYTFEEDEDNGDITIGKFLFEKVDD